MVLEMLFSIVLMVLAGYCMIYINGSISTTVYTDPLGASFWPTFLLAALIVLLGINLIQIYIRTPKEQRNLQSVTRINFGAILKNRLTWGILLLAAYAAILPVTGFLLTSFVMGLLLSLLLGEKRPAVLIISSLLTVVLVFIVFYRGMSIQLPRGSVPFLRNFALTVETFLRNIGK